MSFCSRSLHFQKIWFFVPFCFESLVNSSHIPVLFLDLGLKETISSYSSIMRKVEVGILVFGLRFRSFWWSMFISEYVFVLLLSFCRTTIQKVRPFAILSLCYRFLKVRPLFILSFVSIFLYQCFPFLVGYLCLWTIFGCEPFFRMHVHSL